MALKSSFYKEESLTVLIGAAFIIGRGNSL